MPISGRENALLITANNSTQRRKQIKQFTVNSSKKVSRISPFTNPRNTNKPTRIRSLDSLTNLQNSDLEQKHQVLRTRSNIELLKPFNHRADSQISKSTSMSNIKTNEEDNTDTNEEENIEENQEGNIEENQEGNLEENQEGNQAGNQETNETDEANEANEANKELNETKNKEASTKIKEKTKNEALTSNEYSVASSEILPKATTEVVSESPSESEEEPLMIKQKPNLNVNNSDAVAVSNLDINTDRIRNNLSELNLDNTWKEEEKVQHDDSIKETSNAAFEKVDNSLDMYRMESILSQSTGQERQIPDINSSNNSSTTQIVPTQSHQEQKESQLGSPQVSKSQIKTQTDDKDNTPTSLRSELSNNTNHDSLIFQQSGLTLYNMNAQPSSKNFTATHNTNLSNNNNPAVINRNVSQQSLQRQESYLSFRVPDNSKNRMKMSGLSSNNNNPNNNKQSSNFDNQNIHDKALQKTTQQAPQTSLLSQQAKSKNKHTSASVSEYKPTDTLDIDLSSYLSTQEPEIETRTQQKLWLQRENVASLNIFEEGTSQSLSHIINQTSRFQYEQLSREFLHIRRHTNPILESLQRLQGVNGPDKRLSIDKKSNEKVTSLDVKTSIANSLKTNVPISNSISRSLGLSLKDPKIPDEQFTTDIDNYNELLTTVWKQNCFELKEQQKPTTKLQTSDSSSFNNVNDPTLSARYGYQPSTPNNFSNVGNRTMFGQQPATNHSQNHSHNNHHNQNGFGNSNYFNGMKSQYQPTTRAQQQQEHRQKVQQQQQQQQQNH